VCEGLPYLFIYSSFYDAFTVTHTIQRRMKWWQVNDELHRMWKEVVVASFKYYPYIWINWEKPKNIDQDNRLPGRDFNMKPPEYEAGMLTTRPRCAVKDTTDVREREAVMMMTMTTKYKTGPVLKLLHYNAWAHRTCSKQSKSCPTTRHVGTKAEKSISSYSFLSSALNEVSGQRHAPAALYPPGKDPLIPTG
jgi:uncharacterized protein YbbK (DUF523 family)